MRRLLILRLLVAAVTLAVFVPQPVLAAEGSGGGFEGGDGQCQQASCLGLGTAFGGDIHTTHPDPGCLLSGPTGAYSDTNGQVVTDTLNLCPDLDGDGIPDAPPPPTLAEAVATCPATPAPTLNTSPDEHGWTGLTTWIWDTTSTPASTSTSIRTYPVSCTLTPTRWTADSGDHDHHLWGHDRTTTATTPGTEDDTTPLRYLYERKATYQLTLTVDWQRTIYISGTHANTATLTQTTSRDYPIWEIRSVPAPAS